jgi:uncharacterized protein YjiK
MPECELKERFHLDLEEVSALCARPHPDGGAELLAVGDEDFAVVAATLVDDGLEDARRTELGDALNDDARDRDSGSEWEAVAADGEGRVFVVSESSAEVVVLSPDLKSQVNTIELDADGGPDRRARKLLDDENAGPEGIVLLDDGHLLVAKQRDPILLIEFGPDDPVARDERTKLVPLRSWRLRDDDEEEVESVNDLALDGEGRLHAVSSRSRCIYELRLGSDEDKVRIAQRWHLPDEIEPGKERRAEGLAFDGRDRPVVAIDSRQPDENTFLLERLPR